MTKAEHHRIVETRRKNSVLWRIIHWLGSLHLAMILLATIAIACAVATFIEAEFSTRVAQAYVYKAPWFTLWLGVLMVNLFAVTLTRWPWQRRHAGFIITHYGIIVLLIGAVVGQKLGFEGSVRLLKGQPASQIVDRQKVVHARTLERAAIFPFDPEITPPSDQRPRSFPLPERDGRIIIDGYSKNLVSMPVIIPASNSSAPCGLALTLDSRRLQQKVTVALLKDTERDTFDFSGLATIRLLDALPPALPQPQPAVETLVVFARSPETPVVVPSGTNAPSGMDVRLVMDATDNRPTLAIRKTDGVTTGFPLDRLLGKGPVRMDSTLVEVLEYWPAMAIIDGNPVSVSEEPSNPAAAVRLTTLPTGFGMLRPTLDFALRPRATQNEVAGGGENTQQVDYQLTGLAGGQTVRGTVNLGESIATGWADWTFTVTAVERHAQVQTRWEPVSAELATGAATAGSSATSGIEGLRLRYVARDGTEGERLWVPGGESVFLSAGNRVVRVAHGNAIRPIPFSLELLNFEVPRDEGTEQPADFRATVRFHGTQTPQAYDALVRMNNPGSYPPGIWGQVSGQTYKFSQAQWNPENLNETTLQVLHDPGWLLKWIGSLMICAGITILFYFTPRSAKAAAVTVPQDALPNATAMLLAAATPTTALGPSLEPAETKYETTASP
jgi:hypothetical protein